MNSFGSPLSAMVQGAAQGNQQAQSIMPNSYQPQGRAVPQNPFQGSLDLIVDRLLELGKMIKDQGDAFREEGEELYGMAYKISKINARLTDKVQEDSE